MANIHYDDFEVGDEVIVHEPLPFDKDDRMMFNAGWDPDMNGKEGSYGTVTEQGAIQENDRPDYHIRFSDGESWWWDPAYMELVTAKESISNEDFNSIF